MNLRTIVIPTANDPMTNLRKVYVPVDCTSSACPHYYGCCRIQTEIVRTNHKDKIDIFFVGQGGGKEEEKRGVPFCGPAGRYLRKIIKHLWENYKLFNIAMSNTVRCHPVDESGKDRVPTIQETNYCYDYLWKDVSDVKPTVVMPLGGAALNGCDQTNLTPISRARGKVRILRNIVLIPTFHPSYLARNYGDFNPKSPGEYDLAVINDIKAAIDYKQEVSQTEIEF